VKEISKRVLSREEVEHIPGSYGDPLRVIQNLPGVARQPFLGGQLVIRGASANDSQVYLDGETLPSLFHFVGGPSVISEKFIDDVAYYPGGFGVAYGLATAGVVDIHSRLPEAKQFHGKASIDLGQAQLYLEIPIGDRTTIQIAGRRSYIDAILPLVLKLAPQRSGTTVTALTPVYYDYQFRLTHKTLSFGEFSLFIFGSDDRFKFAQTPSEKNFNF